MELLRTPFVPSDAPLAMRRPEGAMVPIPEERRAQFGTSCHRFAIKALPNWTEPELKSIYNSLDARPEDMADAFVMDSIGNCLRIPLLIPLWMSDVKTLKFPLHLTIVLHIGEAVLSMSSPFEGSVPAEQPVPNLNFWKVVTTCEVCDSESKHLSMLEPGSVVYGFEEDSKLRLPGGQALSRDPWIDDKDGFVIMHCKKTRTLHFERCMVPIAATLDLGASIHARGRGGGDSVLPSEEPFTCHLSSWVGWHCYTCGCDVPTLCCISVAERINEKPTISVGLPAPPRSILCSEKLVSGASLVSVASSSVLDRIGFF